MKQPAGLHHITAICGDPARNAAFYTQILGLRLIKKTVNFDDPGTYHLYYGDHTGSPGTTLTFFPFEEAPRGIPGSGQVSRFAFRIPPGSMGYWRDHLRARHVSLVETDNRFGEIRLGLIDPDGLRIELVEREHLPRTRPWTDSPIPAEKAIAGFDGITISLRERYPSAEFLVQVLGARFAETRDGWERYVIGKRPSDVSIDLHEDPDARIGRSGIGSVHHVAWRTPDDNTQAEWRNTLTAAGTEVSPVRDRYYFHSIYFFEPGGVLFEIATDVPGFTVDETVDDLGKTLKLPPQYEPHRRAIENRLRPLSTTDDP